MVSVDVMRRGEGSLGGFVELVPEAGGEYVISSFALNHYRISSERRCDAIPASSARPLSRPPPLGPPGSLIRRPRPGFPWVRKPSRKLESGYPGPDTPSSSA